MIQLIIHLFTTISNGAYYLFWTSYSIGKLISWLFCSIVNILLYFWHNIKEAGTIFSEDFLLFFKGITGTFVCLFSLSMLLTMLLFSCADLIGITVNILDAGKDSILSSCLFISSIVRATFTTITDLFTTGNSHNANVGQQCVTTFVTMMSALKNLFVLIGNGAWFMLALLPTLLITMFGYIYQIGVTFLEIGYNYGEDVCVYMKDISLASVNYFLDVPLQAIIGCCFIALLFLYRRITLRFIVWLCIRMVQYLRSRLLAAFIASISIFRRRNRLQRSSNQMQSRSSVGSVRSTTSHRLSPKNGKRNSNDENVCVVCRDEQKNVVLMPCRHLCLCLNCSGAIRICPLCRKPIIKILSVYT